MDYVDLYQIHRFDYDDADRGDDRGAARRREGREGALHRRVEHVRVASSRRCSTRSRAARLDAASSSMQNHYNLVLPRGRTRDAAALPRGGSRSCRGVRSRADSWPATAGRPTAATRASREDRRSLAPLLLRRRRLRHRRPRDRPGARRRGATPAQVALAWLLSKPGVTAPIVGASKLPHLTEAVAALSIAPRRRRGEVSRGMLPTAPDSWTLLARLVQPSAISAVSSCFLLIADS